MWIVEMVVLLGAFVAHGSAHHTSQSVLVILGSRHQIPREC